MKKLKTVVIFGAPDSGKTYLIKYWSHIFKIMDTDLVFFNGIPSAGKNVTFENFDIIFVPKYIGFLNIFRNFRCYWTISYCNFCDDNSYIKDFTVFPIISKKGKLNYNSFVYFSRSKRSLLNFIIFLIKKQQL